MPIQLPTFRELKTEDVAPISSGYQQGIQNYINSVKAAYAPMQAKADILSKAAYATYSPIQNLTKAMADPVFMAALEKNPENLAKVVTMFSQAPTNPLQSLSSAFDDSNNGQSSPGLLSQLWDHVKQSTGIGQPVATTNVPVQNNGEGNNVNAVTGGSPLATGGAPLTQAVVNPVNNGPVPSNVPTSQLVDNRSDANAAPTSLITSTPMSPADKDLVTAIGSKIPNSQKDIADTKTKAFQEEMAKNNADKLKEIGTLVQNSAVKENTFNKLRTILKSPEYENMRQVALAGKHELAYFANQGTKEQKDMVGKIYALEGQVIKDSVHDFQGQFRVGEQQLLEAMKPAPGDTVQVAQGKLESLMAMNDFLMQRSRAIAQTMLASNGAKDFTTAQDEVDAKMKGDEVRKQAAKVAGAKLPWPEGKAAINESAVEGQPAPAGMTWMISPTGKKGLVHNDWVQELENDPKKMYRRVN